MVQLKSRKKVDLEHFLLSSDKPTLHNDDDNGYHLRSPQQKFIFSQFWSLHVQDQGVSRVGSF